MFTQIKNFFKNFFPKQEQPIDSFDYSQMNDEELEQLRYQILVSALKDTGFM